MVLRTATATDHVIVDAAFGRFDLASTGSYADFLSAHAQVLAPLERAVAHLWSPWRARFPLLQADLADLGAKRVEAGPTPELSEAEAWGALYVLEGSRLGGSLLAGRVSPGMPSRYLSAAHEGGSWRQFAEALDEAGGSQGKDWSEAAIRGAKSAFTRFADAATPS